MKMDFWEKTNFTDGVPETHTKQLREKKCAIFGFTCPLSYRHRLDQRLLYGTWLQCLRRKILVLDEILRGHQEGC